MSDEKSLKHTLRCETCEYYELYPEFDECMKCTHPRCRDDIFARDITGVEFDRIEIVGCASHSHANTPHRIIDNILEALNSDSCPEEYIKSECPHSSEPSTICVSCKIENIRMGYKDD